MVRRINIAEAAELAIATRSLDLADELMECMRHNGCVGVDVLRELRLQGVDIIAWMDLWRDCDWLDEKDDWGSPN